MSLLKRPIIVDVDGAGWRVRARQGSWSRRVAAGRLPSCAAPPVIAGLLRPPAQRTKFILRL